MSNDSEAAVVARAQAGDPAALARVLELVAPRVLSVTSRIHGRGTAAAHDAAQDAMIEIMHALPGFRGESSLLYYATRIAARRALRSGRRDRARVRRESMAVRRDPTPPSTPLDRSLAERRQHALRELLAGLPADQAEALSLRVVAGMSLDEVAAATGVAINTVRSRVRRAKEALRSRIDRNPHYRELLR